MRFFAVLLLCTCVACSVSDAGSSTLPAGIPVLRPVARVETQPADTPGDAADDPAIWVHPRDPALSLVLGTNKKVGLEVYDLEGRRLASVSDGLAPDNVDVAYDVEIGGQRVDVAGAATRGSVKGFMLWTIDAATRALKPALPSPFPVFGGSEPYGSTLYRRAKDGQLFVFVNDKRGRVEQYQIDGRGATLRWNLVRAWKVGEQVEACVADEELGLFYIAEERHAIWCYGAEPDDPTGITDRTPIDRIGGPSGAVADFEGLTIYYAGDGRGYLIASIQGANRFHVFKRDGDHPLVAVIDPASSATMGDVEETDGIVAESFALGKTFEKGVFIAHDGVNAPKNQNFKLYAWPDVAGSTLLVDAARDPRKPVWRRKS